MLLEVLHEDTREWVERIIGDLDQLDGSSRIRQLAQSLASRTAAQPRLCELGSVVGSVLMRNVSMRTGLDFKARNNVEVQRLVVAMARTVPELALEQHGELVQLFFALVLGSWPDSRHKKMNFEGLLERGALLLARGLAAAD